MKIVLLVDVEKLGKRGEVVDVSSGYGVNYLIPKGLGAKGTVDAINQAKVASQRKVTKQVATEAKVASLGQKIDKKTFQIKVKASKSGRLYGSLTKPEITVALSKAWGLDGTGSEVNVELAQPIRDAGRYPLTVQVTSGTEQGKHDIILSVVAE